MPDIDDYSPSEKLGLERLWDNDKQHEHGFLPVTLHMVDDDTSH